MNTAAIIITGAASYVAFVLVIVRFIGSRGYEEDQG